jgi:hypothetical protein
MIRSSEPVWRKSSRCAAGSCVEIAKDGDDFLMRDGKNPGGEPLRFPAGAWRHFVEALNTGRFKQS